MITQKKALEQIESYCKANNMHLSAADYSKNVFAIIKHDCETGNKYKQFETPCHRISAYLTPKELLIFIEGYNAGLQRK